MADAKSNVAPKAHPGERLANYFDNFFKTVVAISTFGSSLTFTKIVQTPVAPWDDHGFSKISVQYFLSNSFLFFVLDLALTSFAASALTLYRPQAVSWFGTSDSRERRVVMWYATAVSAVLFGLLIAAFVFVALVVTAYAGPAGWLALAATAFFGALGFGVILWQSPLFRASIGTNEGMVGENLKIYGYMDSTNDLYTTPTMDTTAYAQSRERAPSVGNDVDRRKDSGYGQHDEYEYEPEDIYMREKGMAESGRYVDERMSWASQPIVPVTAGDRYYEDRRSSRARRVSSSAPKYHQHENDNV